MDLEKDAPARSCWSADLMASEHERMRLWDPEGTSGHDEPSLALEGV